MDEKTLIGSITFSNIANPNTWDIGEQKALVFSCPSEAKRGEELFTAMQEAAFKAGREAGMRESSEICKKRADWILTRQDGKPEELSNVILRHHASAHVSAQEEILSEIDK